MQLDDATFAEDGRRSGDWLSADGLSRWRSEIRAFLAETRQELQELARLAGAPEEEKGGQRVAGGACQRPACDGQHATETLDRLEMLKRHLAQRIQQRPASALSGRRDGSPEKPLPDPPIPAARPSPAPEDGTTYGP